MTYDNQLILSFPHYPNYGREDYIEFPENAFILNRILKPEEWCGFGMILKGAPQSGKTHLASIFQQEKKAQFMTKLHLDKLNQDADWVESGQAYIIDGIDAFLLVYPNELFHLLNLIREKKSFLLITLQNPLAFFNFLLPDLRSRLMALPQAEIRLSEAALHILITKILTDKQMYLEEKLITYLLTHFSRNLNDIGILLDQLNFFSLQEKKPISVKMIRECMKRYVVK